MITQRAAIWKFTMPQALGMMAALALAPALFAIRQATRFLAQPAQPAQRPNAVLSESQLDDALETAALRSLGEREGAVIVLDVKTGRIRALVNPHTAFAGAFPPGSAIKPFTLLTAFGDRSITRDSALTCREHFRHAGYSIHCSHPRESGALNAQKALAYSCNYFFGKLGERTDAASFTRTLRAFGFGERTGASEGEVSGSVPGRDFRVSDALGEGERLLVTPVQLAAAYAALGNGGLAMQPQRAPHGNFAPVERSSIKIEPGDLGPVLAGLNGAVAYGTARTAGLDSLPIRIAGKTGTATAPGDSATHGWFVALASRDLDVESRLFEVAVLVFLERGHGADAAALARPILETFAETPRPGSDGDMSARAALPRNNESPGQLVRVHLVRENRIVGMGLEDYVAGVMSLEASTETEFEALKANAIAIRTYALANLRRHESLGFDFCNLTHCQRFAPVLAGEAGSDLRADIARAVNETRGSVLTDERSAIAEVYFHAACGGQTADIATLWNSQPREYLRGVRDPHCAAMPNNAWTDTISKSRLQAALQSDERSDPGTRLGNIQIARRDRTGRAERIQIDGDRQVTISGWDFKIIVGRALGWNLLKSSRFDVRRDGEDFVFRGRGFGHGLGLCQMGAHVMAANGAPSDTILGFYFPGLRVGRMDDRNRSAARVPGGLAEWRADLLAGGGATVARYSNPKRLIWASLSDGHFLVRYPASVSRREAAQVLSILEEARRELLAELDGASVTLPRTGTIRVRIHETTGDFTGVTGLPSWSSAAAKGNRIETQPIGLLRQRGILASTLRHELAHVAIEAIGGKGVPRWLAEGIAISFAGEAKSLPRLKQLESLSQAELEKRLANPASRDEMRESYAAALREVRNLASEIGTAGVWRRVRDAGQGR